jgi:hypothetical protein
VAVVLAVAVEGGDLLAEGLAPRLVGHVCVSVHESGALEEKSFVSSARLGSSDITAAPWFGTVGQSS